MEQNKSRDKQIEKLLSALENENVISEDVESLKQDADVFDFINAFNIKPGQNKIKVSSFYLHYKNWSIDPINKIIFYSIIKKLFNFQIEKDTYIFIKNDLVDLNNLIVRQKKAKTYLRKTKTLKNHVENFIDEMEIIPSEKWVSLKDVYKWYIKWRYHRKQTKLNPKDLKNLLKFYFESKIGHNKSFFKLKGEFNMEKINQLRGKQNEEKTNQEIKSEISRTKT